MFSILCQLGCEYCNIFSSSATSYFYCFICCFHWCQSLCFVNERQYNGHRYYTATGIIKCVNLCSWIIRNVGIRVHRYSNYFNSPGLQLNEWEESALGRNKLNTYRMKWNIFPLRCLNWEFFFGNYLDSIMIYF